MHVEEEASEHVVFTTIAIRRLLYHIVVSRGLKVLVPGLNLLAVNSTFPVLGFL